ncbi:MAG TPA: hypothetical protein VGQ71_12755 [Terriglobales bacterium]|jgi:hypothetical protein|nr:hypothetical protein [Terriglobales bacterium]
MGRIRNKEISAALYKKIAPLLPVVAPSAIRDDSEHSYWNGFPWHRVHQAFIGSSGRPEVQLRWRRSRYLPMSPRHHPGWLLRQS